MTIFNFSPDRLNLAGWKLHDQDNGVLTLNGGIEPGTAMTIRPRTYQEGSRMMLHNEGGTLQLKSKSGDLVDEATWQNRGRVTRFLSYRVGLEGIYTLMIMREKTGSNTSRTYYINFSKYYQCTEKCT